MRLTVKRVLKELACKKLDLAKGEGYWYFIYDDIPNNIFETHSVYTVQLNALSIEQWKSECAAFFEHLKEVYPDIFKPE